MMEMDDFSHPNLNELATFTTEKTGAFWRHASLSGKLDQEKAKPERSRLHIRVKTGVRGRVDDESPPTGRHASSSVRLA